MFDAELITGAFLQIKFQVCINSVLKNNYTFQFRKPI